MCPCIQCLAKSWYARVKHAAILFVLATVVHVIAQMTFYTLDAKQIGSWLRRGSSRFEPITECDKKIGP